jgi:hypothetical protein
MLVLHVTCIILKAAASTKSDSEIWDPSKTTDAALSRTVLQLAKPNINDLVYSVVGNC